MHKLTKIVDFEVTRNGGHITIQFDNGFTTRRKFSNQINTVKRSCSLTGRKIKENEVYVYVAIKKKGFSRYYISMEGINKSLTGELNPEQTFSSDLHRQLEEFMQECRNKRKELNEKDKSLREALREIKFNRSKVGQRMSAANRLIELITE